MGLQTISCFHQSCLTFDPVLTSAEAKKQTTTSLTCKKLFRKNKVRNAFPLSLESWLSVIPVFPLVLEKIMNHSCSARVCDLIRSSGFSEGLVVLVSETWGVVVFRLPSSLIFCYVTVVSAGTMELGSDLKWRNPLTLHFSLKYP